MMKLSDCQILMNKKPLDMTIDDWYKYMNSRYIIKYNLEHIKIPNSKPNYINNQLLKNFYKTPEDFLKRLKRTFNEKWVEHYKDLFLNFYNKTIEKTWEKVKNIYENNKYYR